MAGAIVYAATILLLYLGSTLYHAWPPSPFKHFLQVVDHSAIFLLIAGTYTPLALGPLLGPWGWTVLVVVWVFAGFGVFMKATKGSAASPAAFTLPVPRDGMAGAARYSPTRHGGAGVDDRLAGGRRRRLTRAASSSSCANTFAITTSSGTSSCSAVRSAITSRSSPTRRPARLIAWRCFPRRQVGQRRVRRLFTGACFRSNTTIRLTRRFSPSRKDKIEGFVREPFEEIARRSGVAVDIVMERIAAMLRAGTVRRVRQTLLATNLADGALVAWKVAPERIDSAFDYMFQNDPFSGHVVLRSTDTVTAGSEYKLWTTVKVPQGFSIQQHCELLADRVGADHFRLMPAKGIFTLGVGHVRRKTVEPGSKAEQPAVMARVQVASLDELEWQVLVALKREFEPEEIQPSPWVARAAEAGVSVEEFYRVAEELNARKIVGRFSTFLEHVKPSSGGVRVTRFNALFHWAVPPGRSSKRAASWAPSHSHALLLARSGAGVQEREHHGSRARHRQSALARAQTRHRRTRRRVRHSGDLHERLLGRAQRDQAV
jgi:DNA-binding Lrp family transcriptional regulator